MIGKRHCWDKTTRSNLTKLSHIDGNASTPKVSNILALSVVDTLWQKFAVYPTNNNFTEFMIIRVDILTDESYFSSYSGYLSLLPLNESVRMNCNSWRNNRLDMYKIEDICKFGITVTSSLIIRWILYNFLNCWDLFLLRNILHAYTGRITSQF